MMQLSYDSRLRRLKPGERFGMLTVRSGSDDGKNCFVRCDCGRRVVIPTDRLIGKAHHHRKNCGCRRGRTAAALRGAIA